MVTRPGITRDTTNTSYVQPGRYPFLNVVPFSLNRTLSLAFKRGLTRSFFFFSVRVLLYTRCSTLVQKSLYWLQMVSSQYFDDKMDCSHPLKFVRCSNTENYWIWWNNDKVCLSRCNWIFPLLWLQSLLFFNKKHNVFIFHQLLKSTIVNSFHHLSEVLEVFVHQLISNSLKASATSTPFLDLIGLTHANFGEEIDDDH